MQSNRLNQRLLGVTLGLGAVLSGVCAASRAEEPPRWFIRGGPAYANFDASAHVQVAGGEVPGGDVSVHYNTGAAIEVGYLLSPRWQVTLALGVPPRARISGAGTLAQAGKLGELNYAPAVLGLLYSPAVEGALHPYIGAGLNYTWIYHRRDGALQNVRVDNSGGPTLQFGVEHELSPRVAWFFDMKKIWLKTNASGLISSPGGSLPASARVTLDPMILSTGLSFHF